MSSEICLWRGPKVGTTEGKHGTWVRGKKDILTKVTEDSVRVNRAYYPVVSNIGSRTTSTHANTTVLGYNYFTESVSSHSNIELGRVHEAGKFRSHISLEGHWMWPMKKFEHYHFVD